MHIGTAQSFATLTPHSPKRGSRVLLLASVISLAVLAGCASRKSQAPVTDLSGDTGSISAPVSGSYIVKPGDTLYKIAQSQGVDVATLISLNGISDPSQLKVGQSLRISGTGSPAPAVPRPSTTPPAPVTPAVPSEPVAPAPANDARLISWSWPASGKVIQGFNANTKGIDIAGAVGDPVLAAASGKVMYAGNGVRGLGNLILLGHSDGFITAYAHNQSLLVKTGQQVSKGAKIAAIGQTDTTSPRLHFEIRRSGTPVNPLSYLPSR